MWSLNTLTKKQIKRCQNTISSNTFYMLVGDALDSGKNLSAIRMGDGERILMNMCNEKDGNDLILPSKRLSEDWLKNMGVFDIPKKLLKDRLLFAAKNVHIFVHQ